MEIEDWVREEFSSLDFGDKRLDQRLMGVATALSRNPEQTIYRATESWAEAKAAYRLFDHAKVTEDRILSSHIENSLNRCREYPAVLAIQDTSYAVYNLRAKTEGLGVLSISAGKGSVKGLKVHTTLALNLEGIPLGVIDQKIWAKKSFRKKRNHATLPIEKKESIKWIEGGLQTKFQEPEGTRLIIIADREADIYEVYREFQTIGLEFVIRVANKDRNINKKYHRREPVREKLQPVLEEQKIAGVYELEVRDQHNRIRIAKVSVSYAPVTFPPPANKTSTIHGNDLTFVPLWAIFIRELKPPKGETAIEWFLATSFEIKSFEDAIEKMKWYSHRWNIEVYHKVLKSGCAIQECQLRHADRLKKFIALMSIISWRLFWLARIGRSNPELPCTTVLTEPEWKSLYVKTHRNHDLPQDVPILKDVILWIAKLGGFKGRKSDGDPGITSLWRGWNELKNLADHWLLFTERET